MKKSMLAGVLALTLPLQSYAANCQMPDTAKTFPWVRNVDSKTGKTPPGRIDYCPDGNCVIQWKGYGWWTAFHTYPAPGYFSGIGTQPFNPLNVSVDPQGRLKLEIRQSTLSGNVYDPKVWSAAEAVLVSQNNAPINIGYGHYLITFETPVPIADMDKATVFGAFTYDRKKQGNGSYEQAVDSQNNLKELDMIEVSKWAWDGKGTCPYLGQAMERYGCSGSAQLGSQPWAQPNNLVRFPASNQPKLTDKILTLYMYWDNVNTPVNYKVFRGEVNMQDAKTRQGDVFNWTTQNPQYVPDPNSCVQLHLNFYRPIFNFQELQDPNRTPAAPTYVLIRNFEYIPK